jgi:uncharacterized glyoxalase superfamily protein PhnB
MAETPEKATGLVTLEPVLAVRDVAAATAYYRDVLGFEDVWLWGEPPSHGGANWDGIQVQFSLDPALAAGAAGRSLWFRVRNVRAMYALHQERGAAITEALEAKPWGVSEYGVRDLDGYALRFAGSGDAREAARERADAVRIEARSPTWPELAALTRSVGWAVPASPPRVLEAALQGGGAVAGGEPVGCAFLTEDGTGFYYVRDVMVHPDWQGQGVGTALMRALAAYLEAHAPEGALAGLFTGPDLHGF